MTKKILILFLSLMLVMAMAVPAMASGGASITTETSSNTTMTYGVAEGFTVVIPADFNLTTTGADYPVTASGVLIPHGEQLTVTMRSANFDETAKYRVQYNGSFIKYTVKVGETELTANGSTILTVSAGTTSGNVSLNFSTTTANIAGATKAGAHTDTLTFTVAVGTPVQQ